MTEVMERVIDNLNNAETQIISGWRCIEDISRDGIYHSASVKPIEQLEDKVKHTKMFLNSVREDLPSAFRTPIDPEFNTEEKLMRYLCAATDLHNQEKILNGLKYMDEILEERRKVDET